MASFLNNIDLGGFPDEQHSMLRVSSLVLTSLAQIIVVARDALVSLSGYVIFASVTRGRRQEVKLVHITRSHKT